MRRVTTFAVCAVLAPSLLALGACSASSSGGAGPAPSGAGASSGAVATDSANSNVGLTSDQLTADIAAATKTVVALHVKGTLVGGGQTISLDLQLNEDSASGSVSEGGVAIPLLAANGTYYFQFTAAVISMIGDDPTSAQTKPLVGKWVPSTSQVGSSIGASFTQFTSLNGFLSLLSTITTGTAAYQGTAAVGGQDVAKYQSVDSSGSTPAVSDIDIPVTGPCLPVQVNGTGSDSGSMTFVWNQPTDVTAPPAADTYTGS